MEKDSSDNEKSQHISWHPAFIEALQMELDAYKDSLEFYPEYQLTAEPLKIDCVVIKKTKDIVIKKNIAAIFREWNILEYKSPDDYVSVEDFYKVYGYACLYTSFNKVPITDVTVSFVESRYPKSLINHLEKVRGFTVAEESSGIYNVSGDVIPIQIIDNSRLTSDENLWLGSLSNRLDEKSIDRVLKEAYRKDKAVRIHAYLEAIAHANPLALKEAIEMSSTLTLDKVFEETGLAARWEARGEAKGETRGKVAVAQNMLNLGFSVEVVASATQLSPEKINELCLITNIY